MRNSRRPGEPGAGKLNASAAKSEPLLLSRAALEDIRNALARRVREGLKSRRGEIRAIPTYIPPPSGERGEALVIDIGGSNIRVAGVRISDKGEYSIISGPVTRTLPVVWETPESFFDFQAEMAASLHLSSPLPVGYCFSYPTQVTPERDAVLIRWTKNISVPGVEGRRVGDMLGQALRRAGVNFTGMTVLNDTVAALAGGSRTFSSRGEYSDFIGLIVGTGTNTAAYFPVGAISPAKFDSSGFREPVMAVNLESGNFHPPHLTRFDDGLNEASPDPGRQRLEKAVSGRFLPRLFVLMLSGRTAPPYPETREIIGLARSGSEDRESRLARALVDRSADLVSATLAGLIDVLNPEGKVGILGEGGVINNDPSYRDRVGTRLDELMGGVPQFSLLSLDNVNLIGAAAAALTCEGIHEK